MLSPHVPVTPVLVAFCGAMVAGVPAAGAAETAKRVFDLPRGDAARTLKNFAAAGVPIVYLVDQVRGTTTNAVRGEFTPHEALKRMLAGSGLEATQDAATGAFVVSRQRRAEPSGREVGSHSEPQPKPKSKVMKTPRPLLAAALGWLAATSPIDAQTTTRDKPDVDPTVALSPFEVTAENDNGYVAGNTLGATRVNTLIRDLPLQINVVTEDMIRDFGAYDLDQVIDHLPGVNREFNEFTPTYSIRGYSSAAAMRNGVRSLVAPDTTSIQRVEVIKGPAALLYGTSGPGGVINYITRQPSSRTKAEVSAGFGNHGYRRYSLSFGGPLPIADGKKLSYLVDTTWFEHEHGERQRSLRRFSLAPVLRWTPFSGTSITLRAARQKDDFVSSGGLILLPPNSPIRASTSTPRIPHWAVELGRDYNIHSPASWVDVASNVVELEIKQRLNRAIDLRANFADHYRPRSSFREGGSNFLNAGANVGLPAVPDNLAPGSPVSLSGIAPAYDPVARTGWRTVLPSLDDRIERRSSVQLDLVGKLATGPLDHTLLFGFERNLESRSTRSRSWFKFNSAGERLSLGYFTYAPFDPESTAAKDRWMELNQPALDTLPISAFGRNYTNNSSFYSSLTTTFLQKRGLVLVGGRYDDVKGGVFSLPRDLTTGVIGTL
ncbi:MAG TPA: TonB-dependent receptor, partial [Opitutaceae bacterium]|nr:TonB-dependent receptor [Opitutaceae bacterium]